jgi:flagellar biosynthesis protein FliP
MKKISLSSFEEKTDSTREEYQLDPTEEYVINFEEELNIMMEINGKWFYKAPETKTVDLMPAFFESEIKEGMNAGFNRYIIKPVGREQLCELIESIEKEK